MEIAQQEERWLLEKHGGERTPEFHSDVERLKNGEPISFIIGHTPFLDTTIYLDSRPLIPRVETEFWTAQAIDLIKKTDMPRPRILDLCAGSGCIGVAVAHALQDAEVHFAEIDEAHHPTIEKNIAVNQIEPDRTKIFGGNLFEYTIPPYDFILSNPPYLPQNSQAVAQSVREHEPALALYGGEDGVDIIAQIIAQTRLHLSPAGMLFIEHEPEQVAALRELAHAHKLHAATHTDQYQIARYSIFTMAQ
jgi:release factor glutamine methyltransferase